MTATAHYQEQGCAAYGSERVWRSMPSMDAPTDVQTLVLPDGRSDLIARFQIDAAGTVSDVSAILTGPATRPYHAQASERTGWIGVRLRPSYAVLLWGAQTAASEGKTLIGDAALAQRPELAQLAQTNSSPDTLETILIQILSQLAPIEPLQTVEAMVGAIHETKGQIQIRDLARQLDQSAEHLSRQFRRTVGLSPKKYAQIVQFHYALHLIYGQGIDSVTTAFEAGYADQAHLIRSFRQYGGFTPGHLPRGLTLPTLAA